MAKAKKTAEPLEHGEGEAAAVWVSINAIHPWAENPRKVTKKRIDRIARSIAEFGWGAPIVVRRENGEIVAGEGRWRAGKKRKEKLVPVRYVDLTEEQAHKLALIDNRATELTEWENDLLREQLVGLGDDEREFLGWTGEDLAAMLGDSPELDDVPATTAAPDDSEKVKTEFAVLIECKDEAMQIEIIQACEERGWPCRALI